MSIVPERRDDALATLRGLREFARAQPGCARFDVYADAVAADTLAMLEAWENDDVHAAYLAAPVLHEALARIPMLLRDVPDVTVYTVSDWHKGEVPETALPQAG